MHRDRLGTDAITHTVGKSKTVRGWKRDVTGASRTLGHAFLDMTLVMIVCQMSRLSLDHSDSPSTLHLLQPVMTLRLQ
jgi:hypothetical protein